jgi:hypothetical protein
MSMPLQLVFFGELIEGFTVEEVRRNLARTFKLGDEQLDRMFGGDAVVLKRNLGDDEAARYVTHLASLGARAQMRPMPMAANTSRYKVEPSASTPLPRLTQSDGPIEPTFAKPDSQAGKRTSAAARAATPATAEPVVKLRAAAPPHALTPSAFAPPSTAAPSSILPTGDQHDLVTCPKCGERQTMRVLCRNCASNLQIALNAWGEEQALDRAERIEAARARRGLPPSSQMSSSFGASSRLNSRLPSTPSTNTAGDAPVLWGLGWKGRLGRLNYATGVWVMSAVIVAALALGALAPEDSRVGGRLRNIGTPDPDVIGRLRSAEARRAFEAEYVGAKDHRAFAASPDGSWGWVSEAATSDAAMTEALGTCEKHRPATQRPCDLISVNGRTVPPS